MTLAERVKNLEAAYEYLEQFIRDEGDRWPESNKQKECRAIIKEAKKIRKGIY